MSYEMTCPSCHVRLLVTHDVGDPLICPRCLILMHIVQDARAAAHAHAAAQALVTRVSAQPRRTVPSVESETTQVINRLFEESETRGRTVPSVESETMHASWQGYFVVLALTVLAVIGLALLPMRTRTLSDAASVMVVLVLLLVFLTGLILYPLARSWFRWAREPSANIGESPGRASARSLLVILVLMVLFPGAFIMMIFTVCGAMLVSNRR